MTDPMQEMQEARDEINAVEDDLGYQVFRALIGWTIRWAFGFALIWVITAWSGRFDWLWTAGVTVAALSLVVIVAFRIHFFRKTRATQLKLDELTRLVEEQERADRP